MKKVKNKYKEITDTFLRQSKRFLAEIEKRSLAGCEEKLKKIKK